MNKKLTEWIEKARNPRDKSFRNSLYIFLICLIISLLIWFLIKMSDEYIAEVNVPVSYQNAPENKLLSKAGDHLSVRIRAKGVDAFSAKYLSSQSPLVINLAQAELKKSRYFDRYYILTEQFRNQFTSRFDFAHTLLGLYPDTLYLNFEDIISKTLRVLPRVNIECKPRFHQYDSIRIEPAAIKIKGPASMIDTIAFIKTERRTFTDVEDDVETTLKVSLPLQDKRISMDYDAVSIYIPIEEFTESVIEVPLDAVSGDPALLLKTFPETVKVTYQVALKDYPKVKPDMFSLQVAYDQEKDQGKNFLKIKVEKKPDFVRIGRLSPERVEFLIQKQ